MRRERGGTRVGPGFYWDSSDWQIVTVEKQTHVLPGGQDRRYVKVPAAGMLVLAPLLGLSFVIFLPVVGFAMVLTQIGRRGAGLARYVGRKLFAEPAPRPADTPRARKSA